jgi:GAF domain-containing protein
LRKRIAIVGSSEEGLELIPPLEANPEVEIAALVVGDLESSLAMLRESFPELAPQYADRLTTDLEAVLALPGLAAVVDADASQAQRIRFEREGGLQITTPALARLLYAFGPVDAFTKSDLLHALREILDSYDLALDRRGLLSRVLQVAVAATGADRGSLMLWRSERRELQLEVAMGIEAELHEKIRLRSGEGIAGRVFALGRPILLNGKADQHRYDITRERDDVESAISAPLLYGGEVLGVLNLSHARDRDVFDEEDLDFVEQLARLDARLIARAEEFHGLRLESEALRAESEVHRILSADAPLADRLRALCRDLAREAGGVARLYLHDPDLEGLVLQASSTSANPFGPRERIGFGEGVVGSVASSRREAVLRGANGEASMALIALPLCRDEELLGVVTLEGGNGERAVDPARLRSAVAAVANDLADHIRGARLERASRRQIQLTEIVARLATHDDRDELCSAAAEEATLLLEAQDAVLRLRDEGSGRFRIVAWSGVGAWREASLAKLEKSLAADCIRARGGLRVPNLGAQGGPGAAVDAAMVLPLIRDGRPIGSLSVLGKVPEEPLLGECFDTEDEQLLAQLGQHLLTALADLSDRRARAGEMRQDASTGLPGAAVFRERLNAELARSSGRGHSLVLFSLQLRGLDALSDEGRGDEAERVAAQIAGALRTALREFDVVARRGPNHFDALVPEPDGAIPEIATALGRAVRSALDEHPDATGGIDFSLGYAVYPDNGGDAEELLALASEARIDAI